MAGIYIHIPFCKQACHYCDFHFSTTFKDRQGMVKMLQKEIALQQNFLDEPVDTIYFGGGTPSVLTTQQIQSILDSISSCFKISTKPEITLEANPDDLDYQKVLNLKQAGINRLSIGIQTFEDDFLSFMNRAHNRKTAIESIENSLKAGISNLNLDLIYGIPGQQINQLKKDLDALLSFNPMHISAYSLTIEPKTVFGNWSKKGKLHAVEDEIVEAHFKLVKGALQDVGYEHYEISNYCKPGFESRHNSSYWLGKKYLGIGPSAHSYNLDARFSNIANNSRYMQSLEKGIIANQEEKLSETDKINDYLLTRLRTKWGVEKSRLNAKAINQLSEFISHGWIARKEDTFTLTDRGMLLADYIAQELFQL